MSLPEIPSGPAYYNEIDPRAADELRGLIAAGEIAAGDVDERSIEDVTPKELFRYRQRHFFAGYGVWSLALRGAGWPDHRSVVTGSCPCQPFSQAGAGAALEDERHLWPALYWHVRLGEPCPVFGEQVASDDGLGWLDVVLSTLEVAEYTAGAVDLCAAGVGSPNIRQRLYWMAYPENHNRGGGERGAETGIRERGERGRGSSSGRSVGIVDDALNSLLQGHAGNGDGARGRHAEARSVAAASVSNKLGDAEGRGCGERGHAALAGRSGYVDSAVAGVGVMADADTNRLYPASSGGLRHEEHHPESRNRVVTLADAGNGFVSQSRRGSEGRDGPRSASSIDDGRPGPTNGFWRNADWLRCRDGRWRAVESGTSPLAYGLPRSLGSLPAGVRRLAELAGLSKQSLARAKAYRVGGLRGYGNAINAELATTFIREAKKILEEGGW